jgi:uncharacterized membrane protein
MNQKLTQWVSLGLCLSALAVSVALYGQLPEQIPTHFDISGQPDRWSSRPGGALTLPGAMVGTWLLLWLLPKISPKGWRVEPFENVWNRVQVAILGFLLLIHVGVLGYSMGWWGAALNRLVIGAVGLLLMTLGNYLGKTTRNFFLGIRTPWTLASDEVWRRTHRLGGWLLVAAGVVFVLMAFTGVYEPVLVGTIIVAAVVPVVYSFFAYRSLEGFESPPRE